MDSFERIRFQGFGTIYCTDKKKCEIGVKEHYNKSKKENQRVPQCTPEKEGAIMDALKHFKMI